MRLLYSIWTRSAVSAEYIFLDDYLAIEVKIVKDNVLLGVEGEGGTQKDESKEKAGFSNFNIPFIKSIVHLQRGGSKEVSIVGLVFRTIADLFLDTFKGLHSCFKFKKNWFQQLRARG
jgi:hypothetical protein